MKNRISAATLAALALALFAAPLLAHHGSSVYDTKLTTYKGTVTDFQFMNPHSEVWFDVAGADGKTEKWIGECPSLTTLSRIGWSRSTFKAGDPVVFTGNVAKSGTKIMRLRKVVLPSGKEMMIDRGEDYAE
jgi:hypothetical protein